MDGPTEFGRRGVSGKSSCPADRQAASWWSHLATQSQPEVMGPIFASAMYRSPSSLPKGLWDGCRRRGSIEEGEAVCKKLTVFVTAVCSVCLLHCSLSYFFLTLLPVRDLSLLTVLHVRGWKPADLRGGERGGERGGRYHTGVD